MNKKIYGNFHALPYKMDLYTLDICRGYLPADIFVRYQKLKGNDVVFLFMVRMNMEAITIKKPKKEGVSPKEIVDKYHKINKQLLKILESILVYTTEQVQIYIMKLLKNFFQT